MYGLMMDRPLSIVSLIDFAAQYHGTTPIVSRTVEGAIHRYDYRRAYGRIQQLANALVRLGVGPGDRVATVAWNGYRHFELYYAISGIGAVCHTINPRLFDAQIQYIVNHANDRLIFADLTFVPLLERLAAALPRVERYVVMTDRAHMPATALSNALCYEELVEGEPASFDWPELDERTASGLCYTSGTTGNPKGTLYTHRSTVLHAFSVNLSGGIGMTCHDTMLPVVPLFHVNAWGIPYSAPMAGAGLVFPGANLDGENLFSLMESEKVTITAGVPTVWLGLVDYMRKHGKRPSSLKTLLVGGSAAPCALIEALEDEFGVNVCHAWGMTEMSPVGTSGRLTRGMATWPRQQIMARKITQGHAVFGVEMKIVDAAGRRLAHDGKAYGELLVRGPWVTSGYFEDAEADRGAFDAEGWFRTGDVATIDADGWVQIVDRAKDVIKSGGEWISSIAIENAAMGHPDVVEAAVIGVPHRKWQERPLLLVVPRKDAAPTRDALLDFLRDKMSKWWLPDDVVFVAELPHTATGKLLKTKLREQYRDHPLPKA